MFLESERIKAYPTTYRPSAANDVNAGLMTERNLTYLKKLSSYTKCNSYFDCNEYTQNEKNYYSFDLTLAGYHFIFTLNSDDLEEFNDNVYAYINLYTDANVENENTNTLLPNGSETINILDVEDEEEKLYFKGLTFTDSIQGIIASADILLLHKNNNIWKVANNRQVKLKADEIANNVVSESVTTIKNITEQFDTDNIDVASTATINDALITNNATIVQAYVQTIGANSTLSYTEGRVENIYAQTINSNDVKVNTTATITQAYVQTIGTSSTVSYTSGAVENIYTKTLTVYTTATLPQVKADDIILVNDLIKPDDNKSRIVPTYSNITDWSVLAVKTVDGNKIIDWVEAYDGSYNQN